MDVAQVLENLSCKNWNETFSNDAQSRAINALETGKILLCPDLAFSLLPNENKFLVPGFIDKKSKNISFTPLTNSLQGATYQKQDSEELKLMMKRFSSHAVQLVQQLFAPYKQFLKIGRTSFRPTEIAGRKSSYRKDDTRLHVDAFPSSPNQGARILRVFTNINPQNQPRVWRIGEPFADIAKRFLPLVKTPWFGSAAFYRALKITKSYRSHYDHIMLQIHDRMKADLHYQHSSPQVTIPFAPGNTWIVQTDHVSHAAMLGQYVLEQTFYLPVNAMVNPDCSPLRTLEKLTQKMLGV